MAGWSKLVAGAIIGAAGTLYATNKEFRRRLPGEARNFPETVRRRYETAVEVAKESSAAKKTEILQKLREHEERPARRPMTDVPEMSDVVSDPDATQLMQRPLGVESEPELPREGDR